MSVIRSKATFRLDKNDVKEYLAPLRRIGVRFQQLAAEVITDVATLWHHQIMPEHFTPGAESRYGYEPRTPGYLKGTKKRRGRGQGRYVSNILTGRSVRMLSTQFNIKSQKTSATVAMRAPAYFTRPFVGTFKRDGKNVTISRQPNKPREILRVNAKDFTRMNAYAGVRLKQLALRELNRGLAKAG